MTEREFALILAKKEAYDMAKDILIAVTLSENGLFDGNKFIKACREFGLFRRPEMKDWKSFDADCPVCGHAKEDARLLVCSMCTRNIIKEAGEKSIVPEPHPVFVSDPRD